MQLKLVANFNQLHAAGCIQTGADVISDVDQAASRFGPMYGGLMQITNGYPCNGCPVSGKCEAQKRYEMIDTKADSLMNDLFAPAMVSLFGRQKHSANGKGVNPQNIKKPQATIRSKCPKCGCKVRGANHAEHCKPKN